MEKSTVDTGAFVDTTIETGTVGTGGFDSTEETGGLVVAGNGSLDDSSVDTNGCMEVRGVALVVVTTAWVAVSPDASDQVVTGVVEGLLLVLSAVVIGVVTDRELAILSGREREQQKC